jgi:polar amino acid transport system substrate-binding protein
MPWRLVIMFCLAWPLAASAANSSPKSVQKTITIVADEWCPYNCKPDDERPGFMIEIAKEVFEKEGYKVVYQTMPWDQAIEKTRNGDFNAIVGASSSDAPDFVFPHIEQGWMQTQFFVRKGTKWRYLGRDSLSQVKIGVAAAYTYGPAVDAYIKRHQNDPARLLVASGESVLQDNVERLLSEKIDAMLEDTHVMNYYLSQNKLTGKVNVAGRLPVSDQNNIYIAFSPQKAASRRYAKILNDGMQKLRESGELKKILSHYAIQDWRR